MRLIKPYFEILEQSPGEIGMKKHIEVAKRVCYKSEDKITEDSYIKSVDDLIKLEHGAMLEHGTIYLELYIEDISGTSTSEHYISQKYSENKYSKVIWSDTRAYVTTNYRVLVEDGWLDDLQYICEPTKYHEKRITVKFTCDRGVSHEFVRHRVFSFAQESTRYCNYGKDKFGSECTFILPEWVKIPEGSYSDIGYDYSWHNDDRLWLSVINNDRLWLSVINKSEQEYMELLDREWTPQQARSILPNSLKTELIMTGFVSDWKGFFTLRDAKSAHPQTFELANPLHKEFKIRGYIK